MRRLKVATILGTRPEAIRLSRVMAALDAHTDQTIIHTGQNYDYELNGIFFEELDLRRPDVMLEAAGDSPTDTIGKVIAASGRALTELMPDAVLVLGDTNSCLAVISAKRLKIPTFHMEAGNRCFDARVPEEVNRRIVDHTADINLPYSDIARAYLLAEGLDPQRVIKTGSPMFEVLAHYGPRIESSDVVGRLGLEPGGYILVSAHREETIEDEDRFHDLVALLNAVTSRFELPVVLSTHPRTRNRLAATGLALDPRIRQMKPFGFLDYVRLQKQARAVLSDSGTITEEASILDLPALNIRETHERPEGMEEAAVMMVGLSVERTLQGLEILGARPPGAGRRVSLPRDYAVPDVSEKVLRIVLSYTDYVNRVVWRKAGRGGATERL